GRDLLGRPQIDEERALGADPTDPSGLSGQAGRGGSLAGTGSLVPALRHLGMVASRTGPRRTDDRLSSDDSRLDRPAHVRPGDRVREVFLAGRVEEHTTLSALEERGREAPLIREIGHVSSLLRGGRDRVEDPDAELARGLLEDQATAGPDPPRDDGRLELRVEGAQLVDVVDDDGSIAARYETPDVRGRPVADPDDLGPITVVAALLRLETAGAAPGEVPTDAVVPVGRLTTEDRASAVDHFAETQVGRRAGGESGPLGDPHFGVALGLRLRSLRGAGRSVRALLRSGRSTVLAGRRFGPPSRGRFRGR